MTRASWKQAIWITVVVALFAIVIVAATLWLRRPQAPVAPVNRSAPSPLLYHDSSGSVYDLHLKIVQLEERLLAGERHSRRLEEEIQQLRSQREALEKQLAEMDRQIERLRKRLAEQTAPPQAPIPAPNAPVNAPAAGATPESVSPEEGPTP